MNVKFTFDEAQLINNFFEDEKDIKREYVLKRLQDAKEQTEEIELIEIATCTIHKIENLSTDQFEAIFNNLPVSELEEY